MCCSRVRRARGKRWPPKSFRMELRPRFYSIDLSQVVSKYIGETEKNLDKSSPPPNIQNSILFLR